MFILFLRDTQPFALVAGAWNHSCAVSPRRGALIQPARASRARNRGTFGLSPRAPSGPIVPVARPCDSPGTTAPESDTVFRPLQAHRAVPALSGPVQEV